jgi:hypothetical protein
MGLLSMALNHLMSIKNSQLLNKVLFQFRRPRNIILVQLAEKKSKTRVVFTQIYLQGMHFKIKLKIYNL